MFFFITNLKGVFHMATAPNSKANRKGRTISGLEANETTKATALPEHNTLNIVITDVDTKEITSIKRYFKSAQDKAEFMDYMKRGY